MGWAKITDSERKYLIALCAFTPFGPARLGQLKNFFGSYKSAWNAKEAVYKEIGLSGKLTSGFLKHKQTLSVDNYIKALKEKKIKVLITTDEDYPSNLKDLPNAPLVLYYVGNLRPGDKSAIAIVGTRKISSYGKEVTSLFASQLAQYGVTIVSGLALGVDAQAHRATLAVKGRCFAVLASGLDIVTPVTNRSIAVEIVKNKLGAIFSEYPLGYPPLKENFPNRNRIISGLAKAILVPEARIASGTIHTVNHAADQGREVFAIPGSVTSFGSELPNHLIKNGAKVATDPKDLINELNLEVMLDAAQVEKILPSDEVEESIVRFLEIEPKELDEISRILSIDTSVLSAKLSIMELKGMVKLSGEGKYKLT